MQHLSLGCGVEVPILDQVTRLTQAALFLSGCHRGLLIGYACRKAAFPTAKLQTLDQKDKMNRTVVKLCMSAVKKRFF